MVRSRDDASSREVGGLRGRGVEGGSAGVGSVWQARLARRSGRRARGLVGLSVVMVALVVAACGTGAEPVGAPGEDGAAEAPGASDVADPPEVTEPATKPEKLVVRAWGGPWAEGIEEFAAAEFTEKTGIAVEFDLTTEGEIQTKVQQAVAAGQRPPVDVVYTITTFAYMAGVQGFAIPLDTENIVTNFDELATVGKPIDDSTNYVSIYTYTLPPLYNKDAITIPEDISWLDLIAPEYENTFFMQRNFPVVLYPIAKALDLDVATDDLAPVWDIVAQIRPCGVGADVEFIEFMRTGQCEWGGALIGNAFALEDEGVNVGWVIPEEGVTLTSDAMFVPAGLPDDVAYYAQVFVNEVIDAVNLTNWTSKVGTVPTNLHSSPRDDLLGDPAFPFTEEEIEKYAIVEPFALAAEKNDEWLAAYTAALQE